MRPFFLLIVATCTCSFVTCRELSLNYSLVSLKLKECVQLQRIKGRVSGRGSIHLSTGVYFLHLEDMEPVAVVVLGREELPISIRLTQHRLAHQLGGSLPLQEGPALDPLMLVEGYVIQLCSLLKVFNTFRSV